jgi:hypothetical protein
MLLSGVANCPELMLDKEESDQLATAIRGVADQYTMTIDPKTIAWGNLLLVCGMVYGPRFIAIKNRTKKEKPILVKPIRPEPPKGGKTNGPISPSQMFDPADFVNFGAEQS